MNGRLSLETLYLLVAAGPCRWGRSRPVPAPRPAGRRGCSRPGWTQAAGRGSCWAGPDQAALKRKKTLKTLNCSALNFLNILLKGTSHQLSKFTHQFSSKIWPLIMFSCFKIWSFDSSSIYLENLVLKCLKIEEFHPYQFSICFLRAKMNIFGYSCNSSASSCKKYSTSDNNTPLMTITSY